MRSPEASSASENPFQKIIRNPFGKAVLVSGALHLPFVGHKIAEMGGWDAFAREWNKPKMYFDLERLNGKDPKDVERAEKKAEELIDEFSTMVGDTLEDDEIRTIVKKMYGSKSNYEWHQASVTDYFLTGKRNCDSIDRAEHIVFEGVIARLTENERKKYALGEQTIKQHMVATLTELSGLKRTFLLEPDAGFMKADDPGTGYVSADFLKRTTVSNEIAVVHAIGGEVAPSPEIDAVTDQPIPRGYVTVGNLKGSNFVMQQAARENILPMLSPKAELPMELELKDGATTSEEARSIARSELEAIKKLGVDWDPKFPFSRLRTPSPETVAEVNRFLIANQGERKFVGIRIDPAVNNWDEKSVHELLMSPLPTLALEADRSGISS